MQDIRIRIVMTDEQKAALDQLVKDACCIDVPHLVNRSIAVL